jgi:hypothetical protein
MQLTTKKTRSFVLTPHGKEYLDKAIEAAELNTKSLAKQSQLDAKTVRKIRLASAPTDYNSIEILFKSLGLKLHNSHYGIYTGASLIASQPSVPIKILREKKGINIYQASPNDVDWIGDLEYRHFKEDAVPHALLREWYSVNPFAFWIISNGTKKVGHIDILPLKPEALEKFTAGIITERDIRSGDLYSAENKADVTSLYVESLIIDLPSPQTRGTAISCIADSFDSIIGALCEPNNLKNICAMAATREGEKLIRDLGFSVANDASNRADGHPFFSFDCSKLQANDIASVFLKRK